MFCTIACSTGSVFKARRGYLILYTRVKLSGTRKQGLMGGEI
jgi:hypothetical protein